MENIDKFGSPDKIPLKSYEVAPGVRAFNMNRELAAAETLAASRSSKAWLLYIGVDGHDYATSEVLFDANRRDRELRFRKITREHRITFLRTCGILLN